jgi:large subunit ribosomal protein L6
MEALSKTIEFSPEVQVSIDGKKLSVRGPKGENSRVFDLDWLSWEADGKKLKLNVADATKKRYATFNSVLAHIRNMERGVRDGFAYKLAIVYSHFPINVSVKGEFAEINNFLGNKNPRKARIVGKTRIEVKGKEVTVSGIDREAVGQTAANLEKATKKRGKDIRVFQDGLYITQKGE